METGGRESPDARRRNRSVEKRRSNRPRAVASPRVDRDREQSCHGDADSSHSASLAKMIRARYMSLVSRHSSIQHPRMTATAEPDDAAPLTGEEHTPGFLGHPRGLWYLAFTEAWERFSYYGMQSLLVLYMVKYLLLPGHIERVISFDAFHKIWFYRGLEGQPLASRIFGTYTALVYLTPILGGFLADRVLGRRRTVLLGAFTMAAGHFLMAFETAFLFALLCLVR